MKEGRVLFPLYGFRPNVRLCCASVSFSGRIKLLAKEIVFVSETERALQPLRASVVASFALVGVCQNYVGCVSFTIVVGPTFQPNREINFLLGWDGNDLPAESIDFIQLRLALNTCLGHFFFLF